jgi:pimeloyl-ACP methyl ester carboxylesterase
MNILKLHILAGCITLCIGQTAAQVPAAPNGKYATIDGLKLYYEDSGKGTPLILLHHFFATGEQWKAYVPQLTKTYRVINVDLPGHGRSDVMDTTINYFHEKAAGYIIGLIKMLKLDSVYIMGASSGSFIGLYVSTMKPLLVKRLIVVGGQIYYSKQTRDLMTSRHVGRAPAAGSIKNHGEKEAWQLERQFSHFRELYGDPSFTPDVLATITAKALIIHGDNDDIAPVSNALEMYKYIPGSHLWIVPNGKHIPPSEPGMEPEFTRTVLAFLNGDWEKK